MFVPVVTPPLPHIRFHETSDKIRARVIRQLLARHVNDYEYITVRLMGQKANELDPDMDVSIFLGDDKIRPAVAGKAKVSRTEKVMWGLFPTDPKNRYFKNNLDGKDKSMIEKKLCLYHHLTSIHPKAVISIIVLRF